MCESVGAKNALSEFEGDPVEVVARRTKWAEVDFADHGLTEEQKDRIAIHLKRVPRSKDDRVTGNVRLRSFNEGYEVAFIIHLESDKVVIMVIGYDREGELESRLSQLKRTAGDQYPLLKPLLEGRQRKDGL